MRGPVQAVVMAGGEGSRLRPLTSNVPKPMLPIVNRPIMEHIVSLLKVNGVTDVVVTVQFLASVIRNYFDDGSELGVSLSYATEDAPLGTAGSVLGARDLLSGRFLVISGDALTDLDLAAVLEWHEHKGAAATLVLKRMQDPLEFGIVMTSEDSRIERFLEKPTWGQVFTDTVNTGIYVLEPEVLDLIPIDQPYDFSSELFPLMLDKGLPLYGYITDAYWTDVGNSDAYLQAQYDVLTGRVEVDIAGFELQRRVWVGDDVEIHDDAVVEGPALIGDSSRIGPGARVRGAAVIGANAIVARDAAVIGGVVMDRAHVGRSAQVRGGVLGRGASLGEGATLEEGAVLGDDVAVGEGALIKPRVKVYPSRSVEAGAIVTQSLVQERKASRSLFGSRGVSGVVNVGMTPQVALRLGMAYGTVLPRGSTVVIGRDASRAARTLKRAIIAGLTSTGVTCHDLETMPLPVTRFTVRNAQAAGGISVRTSARDTEIVEIRLFDSEGADVPTTTQRKIDRVFFREDYRRPSSGKLGELEFPAHTLQQYSSGLLRSLDLGPIRNAACKVVIDYAGGAAALIGPSILGRLGCDALSVNAFTDDHRPVFTSEDYDRMLADLAVHVSRSGSDLGVLLEPGGEVARLVDDRGRVVAHGQALLAFIRHEASRGVQEVAVPVSSSSVCEGVAAEAGARVRWTATGPAALMQSAAADEAGFAGDADGQLIFPALMPAADGFMTFCKMLELIAVTGRPLSETTDDLPIAHVVRREVRTPWQQKGAVMRRLAQSAPADAELVLLDGIKVVHQDRWALVVPAPDEPSTRVWAEAPTLGEAEELAQCYVDRVTRVVTEAMNQLSDL